MSAVPSNIPPAAVQIFEPHEVYSVAEIMEKMKCPNAIVVRRKMHRHGIKAFRFGTMKYLGADINNVLEAERSLKREWKRA